MNVFGSRVIAAKDDDFWFSIEESDLPDNFRHIGLKKEFAYGRAQMDPSGKAASEVVVAYGYKSRRWGVWLGDRSNITNLWPYARISQVGDNLFFFATTDF